MAYSAVINIHLSYTFAYRGGVETSFADTFCFLQLHFFVLLKVINLTLQTLLLSYYPPHVFLKCSIMSSNLTTLTRILLLFRIVKEINTPKEKYNCMTDK